MSVIGKITAYYTNPNEILFMKTFSDTLTRENSIHVRKKRHIAL